jgi:Ni2+-binding GTPase involved in maturation of urease and hydrogenase
MTRPDYIMIGGFLGAGKTTAMLRLARHLTAGGRRVGLITNDQSYGLVDTTVARAQGYAVREITGGCFCCRFNSLTEAAERLTEEVRPDVFLAEPVGSCTDLRATVQYPLRRLYGDNYRIAPLSVLVDPIRALRVLDLEPGGTFSPKVRYVYGKQLEEADLIVINKVDLVDAARLASLEAVLHERYPRAAVHAVSARQGSGLDGWFAAVLDGTAGTGPAPEVDYDIYAEGEALLGWLNLTAHLNAATPFDGNALLAELAALVQRTLAASAFEVAHLKMTLTPDDGIGDLGVLNLVASDRKSEQLHLLQDALTAGELIVNLRAEGDPEELRTAVTDALAAVAASRGMTATVVHAEHFRPSRPVPTYRVVSV